jgi:uncharacterized membrane protein
MVIREHDISTMQLIRQLLSDVRTLLRQEVALARAEIREELAQLLVALGAFAVAVGTLAVAGLWMLIAVTRGLASMFGWPLAGVYAVVGAALGIVGLVLLAIAWHQIRTIKVLPQTRETLTEHVQWATHRVDQGA